MRPTKLNKDVQTRITTALSAGNTREAAVAYGGISYQTFLNWMRAGEADPDGPTGRFLEAVKRAEGIAEMRMVSTITGHAKDTWQAAAWWLERRKPNDWGRKARADDEPAKAHVVIEHTTTTKGEEDDVSRIAKVAAALKGAGLIPGG